MVVDVSERWFYGISLCHNVNIGQNKNSLHEGTVSVMTVQSEGQEDKTGTECMFFLSLSRLSQMWGWSKSLFSEKGKKSWIELCFSKASSVFCPGCWFSASPYSWSRIRLPARVPRRTYRWISNCLLRIVMVHFRQIDLLMIKYLKMKPSRMQAVRVTPRQRWSECSVGITAVVFQEF